MQYTSRLLTLRRMHLQVINIDTLLTEDHLGRIDISICDIDAKPGDGQCTQLNRCSAGRLLQVVADAVRHRR